MSTNVQTQAMSANLDALQLLLEAMRERVAEARTYIEQNNRLAVVGSMMNLSPDLDSAGKLCGAIIALHRHSKN